MRITPLFMDVFPERGGLTFAFFWSVPLRLQHALNGLDQKGRIRAYGRALIVLCEVCPGFRHGVRVDERQFAGSPASRNHAPAVSHCGMRIVRWFVAVK